MVGYLGYDLVRRFERLPELTEDDLGVPELGMMLATDLVVLDHFDGSAILVANAVLPPLDAPDRQRQVDAAYHQAIGRLDAMTTALSRPIPPMISTVERQPVVAVVSRTPDGGYLEGRRGGQGGDPGRRVLPDRALAALRAGDRRRPAGRLPGAAHDQPEPVHVPAALRRLRHRRLLAGGAPEGERRVGRAAAGDAAPDRRHPAAGRHRRRRRPRWRPSCSPTRRSAPST